MSFILDALKKLEQKKQTTAAPGLMTIQGVKGQEQKKSRFWPSIIAGVIILNAVVLSAVFYSVKTPDQEVAPAKSQAITDQVQMEHDTAATREKLSQRPHKIMQEKVPARPSEPDTAPALNTVKGPADTASSPPAIVYEAPAVQSPGQEPGTKGNEQAGNDADIADSVPDSTKGPAANLGISSGDIEKLKKRMRLEEVQDRGPLTKSPPSSENASTSSGKQDSGPVPDISSLSTDIREGLPDIKISGHIYSNNPSSRLATVNGGIVREGDTIEGGLKVEEITINGVIFNSSGTRFIVRTY